MSATIVRLVTGAVEGLLRVLLDAAQQFAAGLAELCLRVAHGVAEGVVRVVVEAMRGLLA